MPRCILHIGGYKTGSSAIQTWLWRNRGALAEQGFHVSEVLRPGYGRLHRHALDDGDIAPARRDEGETTPETIAAWRGVVEAELDRLSAEAGAGAVVLSDEALGDLERAADVARLRDALAARFDPVQVVVYIRPQHEREASGFSQRLRHGDAPDQVAPQPDSWRVERLDYDRLLARWADAFGAERITPRIYAAAELAAGDAAADFAAIAGIDAAPLQPAGRHNEGLRPPGQRLLRWLNESMPRYLQGGGVNTARMAILPSVNRAFAGPGLLPARTRAEAFYNLFAESNEAVRRRWFPERETLFNVDFARYPEAEESLDPSPAELALAMKDLIADLGRELNHRAERIAELRGRAAWQRRRLTEQKERIAQLRDRIAQLEKRLERQSP